MNGYWIWPEAKRETVKQMSKEEIALSIKRQQDLTRLCRLTFKQLSTQIYESIQRKKIK